MTICVKGRDKIQLFFLSSAVLEDGSASTDLSRETKVSETVKVKRPVGRPRKHPRNVEQGKLVLT